MNQQQLDQKRDWIKGKYIVGIDQAFHPMSFKTFLYS